MIRFAKLDDVNSILEFISLYWNKQHIYVADTNYFNYEFINDQKVNFVISINNEEVIEGILGFIKYDIDEDATSDIFTAMWMVKPNTRNPLIGPNLIKFLAKDNLTRSLSTIGLSNQAYMVLKLMKFKVGQLSHFYLINPKIQNFKLIQIDYKSCISLSDENQSLDHNFQLQEINDEKIVIEVYNNLDRIRPIKSQSFFKKKYFNNPYYSYLFFGLKSKNDIFFKGLLIIRKVVSKESSVLRIIDYFGDHNLLANIKYCLIDILNNYKSEYIDLYQYGIDDSILLSGGFKKNNFVDNLVIPNYFEPFQMSNIKINYSTNLEDNFCFFKGDGDQDRPNIAKS